MYFLQDNLEELQGTKCQAPFTHAWGESYHNALIFNIVPCEDITSMNQIQVGHFDHKLFQFSLASCLYVCCPWQGNCLDQERRTLFNLLSFSHNFFFSWGLIFCVQHIDYSLLDRFGSCSQIRRTHKCYRVRIIWRGSVDSRTKNAAFRTAR